MCVEVVVCEGCHKWKTEGVKWFREEYPPAAALNRKADGSRQDQSAKLRLRTPLSLECKWVLKDNFCIFCLLRLRELNDSCVTVSCS